MSRRRSFRPGSLLLALISTCTCGSPPRLRAQVRPARSTSARPSSCRRSAATFSSGRDWAWASVGSPPATTASHRTTVRTRGRSHRRARADGKRMQSPWSGPAGGRSPSGGAGTSRHPGNGGPGSLSAAGGGPVGKNSRPQPTDRHASTDTCSRVSWPLPLPGAAWGQTAGRPLRLIVPFTPGGSNRHPGARPCAAAGRRDGPDGAGGQPPPAPAARWARPTPPAPSPMATRC